MSPGHNGKTTMLPSSLLILVTTMILLLCGHEGGTTGTNGFFRLVRAEEKEQKNNTEAAAPSSDLIMTEDDDGSSSAVTIDNVYSYVIVDDADNMTTTEDIESAMEDGFGTSVPDANITGINLLYNYSVIIDEEATEIEGNETTSNATSSNETVVDCPGFDYDCYSCIRNGCHWCAYDSLCFNTPEFVSKNTITSKIMFPGKAHSCKLEKDFTQTQCTADDAPFDDPMYGGLKWIFDMIKVKPVWERGIYGNGIHVRINDAGIELSHPEFIGRVDFNESCDGSPGYISLNRNGLPSNHGNVVTALVGASGNNSVGIAPKVTFSLCPGRPETLFSKLDQVDISQNSWAVEGCGYLSLTDIPQARYLQDVHANEDDNSTTISMISDGLSTLPENPACQFIHNPENFNWNAFPCDRCTVFQNVKNTTNIHKLMQDMGGDCVDAIKRHCDYFYREDRRACEIYKDLILITKYPHTKGECQFKTLSDEWVAAFARGVEEGRNGKGIIFVFAAGNENRVGDDTNFQGFGANTRFTIPVASVGKNGTHAAYSTPGASVFIAAPGGDIRQSETTVVTALNNGECGVDGGDGTSWAAPLVSGVVALMLEANPNLGWRDVQDILARTAQLPLDNPENKSRQVNGARLVHSNWYGFGIINADAAVNKSLTHVNFGPEKMLLGKGSGELRIYDGPGQNATTVDVTIESNSSEPFVTESVYLSLRLNHTSRGHLLIKLTSPNGFTENGTVSTLSPGSRPEDQTNELMKFTTVRHWGEDPNGNWTISLYDRLQGDVSECSGKSAWHWQLEDDFSSSPFNGALSCEFNPEPGLLEDRFCFNGRVDRSNNTEYGMLCTAGVEKACKLLDAFENDVDDVTGLKVTEACCACGGGNPPELYPDYLTNWTLEVYGHYNATNGTTTTTNTTITTQVEPSIDDSSVNEEDTDVTEPPAVVVDADDSSSSSSGTISIPNKLPRVLAVAVAAALIIFASHY